MFIDQFTDNITEILASYQNNIILGEFNLHVDNLNDANSYVFMDTVQALGLNQLVSGSKHKHGNTLDLILSEAFGEVSITECRQGKFISDHRLVHASLNIPKHHAKRDTIKIRNLKKVNLNDLTSLFNHDNIKQDDLLSSLSMN